VIEDQNVGEGPEDQDPATDGDEGAGTAGMRPATGTGLPMEPAHEAVRRLEEESAAARDRYLRLAAEFDNFRKRMTRERDEIAHRAQAGLTVRLLEVLDDLDRVVKEAPQATADVMQQALVLIDRKLRKELETAGLERIDPVGQAFDPTFHEAVSVIPPADGAADHTVAATFQAGYRFKGSLIRPARVQVYSSEGHA
jgi:molecular chaperone GrpE